MSDVDPIAQGALDNYNYARNSAVSGMENTPDEAVRSVELSRATGVPAPAILGDLPEFEASHKRKLAGEIIAGNHHLADYVNANPMHPRVSSDDYGQLDAASAAVTKLGLPRAQVPSATAIIGSTMSAAIHGAVEGWGSDRLGAKSLDVIGDVVPEDQRLIRAMLTTGATPVEAILRGVSAGIEGVKEGAAKGAETAYKQFGGTDSEATRFGREFGSFVEYATTDLARGHTPKPTPEVVAKAREAMTAARPWLDAGREPPAGLHPEIDKLKVKQNDLDVRNLEEATREAQASATRQRDPDMFADFIRQHTDASIGVSAEAVQRLYGDKVPEFTDGKFGFVPGFADSYRTALQTGGDVQIPLADWLAKVDPEIAKELKDDIRVRPGAVTKAEVEATKEFEPREVTPDPAAQVRAAAGLEPMFSVGDRKLSLVPLNREQFANKHPNRYIGGDMVDFEIHNEQGKPVGYINMSLQKDGKQIYIENMEGVKGNWTNDLGPAAIRDLMRQLKEQFPEATELSGHRISGMRREAGTVMSKGNPIVKLDSADVVGDFKKAFDEGGWVDYGNGIEAHMLPKELYTQNDVALKAAVEAELKRIAPKELQVEEADAIRRAGSDRTTRGAYIQNVDQNPIVLWSLNSPDAVGTVRHEAIHHLRNYGFFKPEEWSVLQNAAKSMDWMEKYGINERYGKLDENAKLEEAIADAYKDWANRTKAEAVFGKMVNGPIEKIFKRIKQLLDAIGAKFKEILGKEPTWEELFRSVDEGKVGAREGTKPLNPSAYKEMVADLPEGAKVENKTFLPDKSNVNQDRTIVSRIRKADGNILAQATIHTRDKDSYYVDHIENLTGSLKDTGENIPGLGERIYVEAAKASAEEGKKLFAGTQPTQTSELARAAHKRLEEQGYASKPDARGVVEIYPESKLEPKFELGEAEAKERDLFAKASAVGMTQDQYRRYMKLIEKRNLEDQAKFQAKAEAEQRRRQSAEWKAAEAEMRPEAVADVNARPAVAADDFFREGTLYGTKMDSMPKLGLDHLTREQEAAVPSKYIAKRGLDPNELAPLFGFKDGNALIESMVKIESDRQSAKVRPSEYKRLLINLEVERRMQKEYGNLEENVLEAAKEQALSQTQLDILHEETVALAEKAKLQAPIAKGELQKAVQGEFEGLAITGLSSDKFMQFAGKAGRMAEDSLLRGKYAEAFKAKQQQYNAILYANEAKAFEKEFDKYEKVAKRFSKREVKGVNVDATTFIQQLLQRAGEPVRRTADDLATGLEHAGYDSLQAFMDQRVSDGFDSAVTPELGRGEVRQLDQMKVGEWRQFNDAINNLLHIGREMEKIEIAGQKMEFAEWRSGVIENISQLPVRPKDWNGKNWFYKFDAEHLRMEELIKDLDLRQELGPLFKAIIEPMVLSKAKEYGMMEQLSKRLQTIRGADKEWQKTLGETIDQDFFVDPYDGIKLDMTRENMIQIMLNWGNEGNIEKFSKGYGSPELHRNATKEEAAAFRQKMKGLIDQHATKADWDYVQAIWDIFKDFQKDADTVYRNTSGIPPKWIETSQVETPHGTYAGGYYPIIYDKLRSNINVIQGSKPEAGKAFGSDYFRASTAKGYTNERTGYSDRIDFQSSIESLGLRMQQMIHDISFRDSVMQASKVIYDKQIRGAIRKHYGAEYEAQLEPWLKRVANNFNQNEQAVSATNAVLHRARINLIGHALPLNLKVILSPSTGVMTPKSVASFYANLSENTKLAMEKSNEIPHTVFNIDRDYREGLERTIAAKGWAGFQADAVRWGFMPISKIEQQTRMMTFVGEYRRGLERGLTETESASMADSRVRERHGSASVVDMPAIMQSTEAMKMMTMFYGFFSTMQNWQRQLVGNVRRGEWKDGLSTFYGAVLIPTLVGAALFNERKEGDSWFKVMGKSLMLTPLSNLVGVRDAANYFLQSQQPRSAIASILTAVGGLGNDVKKYVEKKPIEKPISHAANVLGLVGGVPGMAQIGRSSQFAYDVATNKQRPRNIQEWTRGIITGEARLKK